MYKNKEYAVYIGDLALDEYYRCSRWPKQSDKENVETLEAVPGGMIANAACVRAALDKKTLFWTCMNDGPISKFLLEDLEKRGIDTSLSVVDNSLPDSKTMIFLTGDDHSVFIPIIDIDHIDLTDEMMKILQNASYVYSTIGTLMLLRYKGKKWNDFAHEIKINGTKVIVDFDVDYERNGDNSRFYNVDIGFFNETGFDSVRENRSYQEEVDLLHSFGMNMVIVTLAEKGCLIYQKDKNTLKINARKVDVIDVTGAGDTFCSSFCTMMDELGIEKAAAFATAQASICISNMGARSGAVSKQEVLKVLNS